MITHFFILNFKGDSLFYKEFRDKGIPTPSVTFWHELQSTNHQCGPCFNIDGFNYIYVNKNDLYYVIITPHNLSPLYIMQILLDIDSLIDNFCGEVSETKIRDNFSAVMEIIDEVFDYGHVQTTQTDDIKPFLKSEVNAPKTSLEAISNKLSQLQTRLSSLRATTDERGRAGGSKRSIQDSTVTNCIYLDSDETIHTTFSKDHTIVSSDVIGTINLCSFLTGNVDVTLNFSDTIILKGNQQQKKYYGGKQIIFDSVAFHSHANPALFDRDATIAVKSVPSGDSEVLRYRMTEKIRQPLSCHAFVKEINPLRFEVHIRLMSLFGQDAFCKTLQLSLCLPQCTTTVSFSLKDAPPVDNLTIQSTETKESAEYRPAEKIAVWVPEPFGVNEEPKITIFVDLNEPLTPLTRRQIGPINLDFQIPNFLPSSTSIHFTSVNDGNMRSNIQPTKFLRKRCLSGSYVVRL
ncbi:Adaptor protein complex 4 (AP-4), mu subunit [Blattamonas nauphoetae]|uniref:Adaptor protein complex 4 (AP-4), mu subunit n=1 Tax=Blattamonas nauphoetae TaxID=2049346 RepID=A0ABQ9WX13_9EUKA|nr:Adaptor protein complex 4 (AP-4), mu subunit [Blattamonas nauphoetae]